jgi:hypothetical protein
LSELVEWLGKAILMDTETIATASHQTLESENERLRARIKILEGELSGSSKKESDSTRGLGLKFPARLSEETEDRLRDLPRHALDELSALANGLSFAFAENLRATTEIIDSFASELFERSRREGRTSRAARASDEQPDVDTAVSHVAMTIHDSLETPRRVVERFLEGYEEDVQVRTGEKGGERSSRRTATKRKTSPGS